MTTASYLTGQQIKVRGFDMNCNHTIELARFVAYIEHATFDCVIELSGIRMMSKTSDFV